MMQVNYMVIKVRGGKIIRKSVLRHSSAADDCFLKEKCINKTSEGH